MLRSAASNAICYPRRFLELLPLILQPDVVCKTSVILTKMLPVALTKLSEQKNNDPKGNLPGSRSKVQCTKTGHVMSRSYLILS